MSKRAQFTVDYSFTDFAFMAKKKTTTNKQISSTKKRKKKSHYEHHRMYVDVLIDNSNAAFNRKHFRMVGMCECFFSLFLWCVCVSVLPFANHPHSNSAKIIQFSYFAKMIFHVNRHQYRIGALYWHLTLTALTIIVWMKREEKKNCQA